MVVVLQEFTVVLQNRPGALGAFDTALGRAGVNITGYQLHGEQDEAVLRFTVDDPERTRGWLQAAGHKAEVREVLAVPGKAQPGFVGEVAQRLGGAGVDIEASYPATLGGVGHVVFAVPDAAAGRKALA